MSMVRTDAEAAMRYYVGNLLESLLRHSGGYENYRINVAQITSCRHEDLVKDVARIKRQWRFDIRGLTAGTDTDPQTFLQTFLQRAYEDSSVRSQ